MGNKLAKRVMSVLAAAAIAVTALPQITLSSALAVGTYGKINKDKVVARYGAGTDKNRCCILPVGYVVTIKGTVNKNGEDWYKVSLTEPDTGKVRDTLYIMKTFVDQMSDQEAASWEANPIQTSVVSPSTTLSSGGTTDNAMGAILKGGVNVRAKASTSADSLGKLEAGYVLELLSIPSAMDEDHWVTVRYNGKKAYIVASFVKVLSYGTLKPETDPSVPTPAPAATEAPTAAPTAAPALPDVGYVKSNADKLTLRDEPDGDKVASVKRGVILRVVGPAVSKGNYNWYPVIYDDEVVYVRSDYVLVTDAPSQDEPTAAPTKEAPSSYGHIYVTADKVNVRETPGGDKLFQVGRGTVWTVIGPMVDQNGSWYPVTVNGEEGFISADFCYKLTAAQEDALAHGLPVEPTEQPTATPAPTSVNSSYVITTSGGVNLRVSASKNASAKANVSKNTILPFTATTTVDGVTWYKVSYLNQKLWVQASYVKVMTNAEYSAYIADHPEAKPTEFKAIGTLTVIKGGTNLREAPNGAVIGTVERGEVYQYFSTTDAYNYTWYYVETDANFGYLRGDCVDASGSAAKPTSTPAPTATPKPSIYPTLKLGSQGTSVKALVQKLIDLKYYTGSVTSTYTAAVETAVKKFQKARSLPETGIADDITQSALFGTVPTTTSAPSSMKIYAAEKIDWSKGEISKLVSATANFKIYDVYTGKVWNAHYMYGTYHADVEPLTAADTAILCQIYGVSKASEIASKNLYQRRPCLITIGTRTFACSLYGIPHGEQTITNNNYNGQGCLHFTNSRTHGTKKIDSGHMAAIEYAWLNAPNGHK